MSEVKKVNEREQCFLNGAILNKRELCYCIAEWQKKCNDGNFEIALCEESQKCLKSKLAKFARNVKAMDIGAITTPFTTFSVLLYAGGIQLGLVTYGKNVDFDENGHPIYPDTDPNVEEVNPDDDDTYELIYREHIPSIPISVWEEWNNVKHSTAKSWVQKERMQTFNDGSRNLRVSPIQYVPDALYDDDAAYVRLRLAGRRLPEEVVNKYPALSGEIFDIMIPGIAKSDKACKVYILSRKDGDEKISMSEQIYRANERKPFIKTVASAEGVRSTMEQHYHSPIGEISSGAKFRAAETNTTEEQVKLLREMHISGVCKNNDILPYPDYPVFTLTFSQNDTKLFEISGTFVTEDSNSSGLRLARAIYFGDKGEEYRNIVLEKIGNGAIENKDLLKFSWNRHSLLIRQVEIFDGTTDEQIVAAFSCLRWLANHAFGYSEALLIAALYPEMDGENHERIINCLESAGYEHVDNEDSDDEIVLYYAYEALVH